jgi:hypothetical protein
MSLQRVHSERFELGGEFRASSAAAGIRRRDERISSSLRDPADAATMTASPNAV